MTDLTPYADILGADYVLTGSDTAKFSRDWPGTYTWSPLAVLRPASTDEVSQVVKAANTLGHKIVPVSGMTGLAGGGYAEGAVMISLDRMNRIEEIRPAARIARVQAGVILSSLHDAVDAHDLVFPLTFGAKGSACIGGCLSTNAGGSNVLKYGNTRDLCFGIEVVLPNGDVMDLMSELHKDNSGYNLKHLMIGAEGTLGIITRAVLKLYPKPKAYATAMVAVPSLEDALSLLNRLQEETGNAVEAFEFMPRQYMEQLQQVKPGTRPPFDDPHDVNILVEIGSTVPADCTVGDDGVIPLVAKLEETLMALFEKGMLVDAVIAKSEGERQEMWERREAAAEVQLANPPLLNNDIAVPLDKVAAFYDDVHARIHAVLPSVFVLSIAHLGDGNLHMVVELGDEHIGRKDEIMELVEETVKEYGGSFSAEHGIGLAKLPSMRRRKDPVALDVMRAIKRSLDPQDILNPGKLLP